MERPLLQELVSKVATPHLPSWNHVDKLIPVRRRLYKHNRNKIFNPVRYTYSQGCIKRRGHAIADQSNCKCAGPASKNTLHVHLLDHVDAIRLDIHVAIASYVSGIHVI